jgi:hypothetical protein
VSWKQDQDLREVSQSEPILWYWVRNQRLRGLPQAGLAPGGHVGGDPMTPTNKFRYVRRQVSLGDAGQYAGFIFVLQQGFLEGHNLEMSWADVPIVDEATGESLPTYSLFFGVSR